MKTNQYQIETLRTFAYRKSPLGENITDMLHCAIGISTEVAELINAIRIQDKINVKEEIGDIMWYISNMFNFIDEKIENTINDSNYLIENSKIFSETSLIMYQGQLLDIFKKTIYYNKMLDEITIKTTLINIIKHLKLLCKKYDFDFENLLTRNIEKLRVRFPEKFTESLAENRNLDEERKALENEKTENMFFGILDVGQKFYVKKEKYIKKTLISAIKIETNEEIAITENLIISAIIL